MDTLEPAAKRVKFAESISYPLMLVIHLEPSATGEATTIQLSPSHPLFTRSRQLSNLIRSPTISTTENNIYLLTVKKSLFELLIKWCDIVQNVAEPTELTPELAKRPLAENENQFLASLDWKTTITPLSHLAWQLELLSLTVATGKWFSKLVEATKTDEDLLKIFEMTPDFSAADKKTIATEKQEMTFF